MLSDDELDSIRADIHALQLKVGALEALLEDHPELQKQYEALLQDAQSRLLREQANYPAGSEIFKKRPN